MFEELEEFKEKKVKGFESIALDITGFCNTKCKYYPLGNDLLDVG